MLLNKVYNKLLNYLLGGPLRRFCLPGRVTTQDGDIVVGGECVNSPGDSEWPKWVADLYA